MGGPQRIAFRAVTCMFGADGGTRTPNPLFTSHSGRIPLRISAFRPVLPEHEIGNRCCCSVSANAGQACAVRAHGCAHTRLLVRPQVRSFTSRCRWSPARRVGDVSRAYSVAALTASSDDLAADRHCRWPARSAPSGWLRPPSVRITQTQLTPPLLKRNGVNVRHHLRDSPQCADRR